MRPRESKTLDIEKPTLEEKRGLGRGDRKTGSSG